MSHRFPTSMLLFALSHSVIWAQATGTISGSVTDASGAFIPGAKITGTNTETNQSRTVFSGPTGQYVLVQLPVGPYQVRVEKEGFAPFVQNGIQLQTDTQVQADAALQVRASNEQVTVSSTASLVQTTSSTLVQVVDSKRVSDLPLNGRNVLQLLSLNAGVTTSGATATIQGSNLGGAGNIAVVSVNGSRSNTGNFLLDNADHNEAQTGLARPFPNVDAVEEFSLQTSSFDAQYGRGVGGIVNVVTKGGTNAFHGAAFEFLRNYQMNAANFFSGRDSLKRNQYGGAIGGPIRKDRTFFFGSYQGTRIRNATPGALRTAPSEAMKNGNFSEWLAANGTGAIHDPLSPSTYFPNNVIPRSRFDPVSVSLLDRIPASTERNYQIRFGTPVNEVRDDQLVGRADHTINERHRISARHFYFYYHDRPVMLPTNLLYASDGQRGASHSLALNHNFTISPKWLNALGFAYTYSRPNRLTAEEPDVRLQTLGSRVVNAEANLLGITVSGWSGISLGNAATNKSDNYTFHNMTSFATGRHNLRFGGEARFYRTGFRSFFLTGGTATFTGQYLSDRGRQNTGNSYAELVLGLVGNWRQLSVSHMVAQNNLYALFFQDDIRLTSKLTLNMGVRWDPKPGLREEENQYTTFVPGRQSTAFPTAPRGLLFYGDEGVTGQVIPDDWNNLAPRIGLAYQIAPKTVVRAAYGIFFDEYMGLYFNRTVQGQPWVSDATLVGPLQLADPYRGEPVPNTNDYKPDPKEPIRAGGTYAVPTRDMRAGWLQNWNLVVERELPSGVLFRAAYVGSKGTHLIVAQESNPGIYGPGATAANVNQRRPYEGIGPLQLGRSGANSSFNSLQLTVQRRWGHGFSLLTNYTWGHSIDYNSFSSVAGNDGGPDPFNLRNNRGPSNFDIRHRFVVSGVWELPLLANQSPLLRHTLGGWQTNYIFSAETGLPLTVTSGVDNDFNGVAGDFADYSGAEWKLSGSRSKDEQILRWFDTRPFSRNAIGTIGSGRRGQLRGPGSWNTDFSLFKNFTIGEGKRLQLRGEFFNVFNHANLGDPNVNANSPNFGLITGASSPRIVQVATKFIF